MRARLMGGGEEGQRYCEGEICEVGMIEMNMARLGSWERGCWSRGLGFGLERQFAKGGRRGRLERLLAEPNLLRRGVQPRRRISLRSRCAGMRSNGIRNRYLYVPEWSMKSVITRRRINRARNHDIHIR